ncbi:MAG: Zn-dependent hydrolase [Deltaproteobacteria bacterium]|nr:Zn-dependent hydrolase [Deltaproteobacteria bacterium]
MMARRANQFPVEVNGQRLWADLSLLSRIGMMGDGMHRLAFSIDELRARQLMIHLLQKAGLEVRTDGIGNTFGRLPGRDRNAPAVLMGSHIDTVPQGGRFDGAVGVMAALEVLRTVREQGLTHTHPLELVIFVAEESSRFGVATIGSGVMVGEIGPDQLEALRDAEGTQLSELLARMGITPEDVRRARRPPKSIKAYLELHIEQGRILEEERLRIGVVTAIAAATRFRVRFVGRADHSGATPMHLRKDALVAAAHLIAFVEELCREKYRGRVVGTVGTLALEPNALNVVPGRVELGVDVRGVLGEVKQEAAERIMGEARRIGGARDLTVEVSLIKQEDPVPLDRRMVEMLRTICRDRGIPHRLMPSGAGHDAMKVARVAPTAMLLIPCREGISHNPAEWTEMEHVALGANCLLEAAVRLAR